MPMKRQQELPLRKWYLDALCSAAFLMLAIFLIKPLKVIPALAAMVVLFNLGMAYFMGRSALRGLANLIK